MSFIAKLEPKEPKEYELSPKGTYPLICCDIEKPPSKEYPKKEKDKKTGKLVIVPGQFDIVEQVRLLYLSGGPPMKDGRPFMIRYQRAFRFYPTSPLRLFLEAWKGETIAENEWAQGIDLERWAIGRVGMATIEHTLDTKDPQNPKTWANIKTLTPMPYGSEGQEAGLKALLTGYVRMKDREGSEEAMRLAQERLGAQRVDPDQIPF